MANRGEISPLSEVGNCFAIDTMRKLSMKYWMITIWVFKTIIWTSANNKTIKLQYLVGVLLVFIVSTALTHCCSAVSQHLTKLMTMQDFSFGISDF